MTSYERLQTFGLYVAVLRKGEPSPVLPQSDEDAGVGAKTEPTPLVASAAPVTIDFDGFQQRVVAVPGVSERQYSRLAPGAAGTVFYLEAPAVAERGGAPPVTGSTVRRYRLSDRSSVPFASQRRRLRRERGRQEARLPHAGAPGPRWRRRARRAHASSR